MFKEIAEKTKEHEKVVEGKAQFDAKKPDVFEEIAEKAKEKEEIAKGKEKFDAKKPEMFKEIAEKANEKKQTTTKKVFKLLLLNTIYWSYNQIFIQPFFLYFNANKRHFQKLFLINYNIKS